jgi:hypothetical protein
VSEFVLGAKHMCCLKHAHLGWFVADACPECPPPDPNAPALTVVAADYEAGVVTVEAKKP